MQRLQGNFMFVFSCVNQICFGWADAETNIKGAYWTWEKKYHSILFDIGNKMAHEIQC